MQEVALETVCLFFHWSLPNYFDLDDNRFMCMTCYRSFMGHILRMRYTYWIFIRRFKEDRNVFWFVGSYICLTGNLLSAWCDGEIAEPTASARINQRILQKSFWTRESHEIGWMSSQISPYPINTYVLKKHSCSSLKLTRPNGCIDIGGSYKNNHYPYRAGLFSSVKISFKIKCLVLGI